MRPCANRPRYESLLGTLCAKFALAALALAATGGCEKPGASDAGPLGHGSSGGVVDAGAGTGSSPHAGGSDLRDAGTPGTQSASPSGGGAGSTSFPKSSSLDAGPGHTTSTSTARTQDAGVTPDAAVTPYPPEYCAYFLTGEVDLVGTDADHDGVPNGWDHCPNNPHEWLDSDRDGIGNNSDPDMDGDGIPNDQDADRDGDGFDDTAEVTAGSDPTDPSSVPGQPRFDLDLGVRNPNPGWYKGDLHVHVEYSHDSSSPLVGYPPVAVEAGLDFLCITDHDVFLAPFAPTWNQDLVLLIPGIEWGGVGHANMWGVRTNHHPPSHSAQDTRLAWRHARLQGGVQSLNHYGAQKDGWDPLFAEAPDLLDALDVIEIWNLVWAFTTSTNVPSMELWDRLLMAGHRLGAVGGGDSHTPRLTLSSPTTVVWAKSLSVLGILDGIRHGRTYVTQSESTFNFEGRPELEFRVDANHDGVFEAMLGDEVAPGPITLQVNVKNAKGPVVLIRNGVELTRFAGHASGASIEHTFEDVAPPGAYYRVEMRNGPLAISPMRLISSPIYVGH